jgi:hypothetical protein
VARDRASDRACLPLLSYVDYGIQTAHVIAKAPESRRRGGPAWGYLRYTTDRSFTIVKDLHSGSDKTAVNRAATREILGLADFRGATASAGESWLRDCAHGAIAPSGTGSFSTWLTVGNVQQMTHVVRSLRGL